VSQQQRDALDQLLRDAPLDLGGEVAEQRIIFGEMMGAIPVPADVTTSSASLGGIPVVNVEAAGADHAKSHLLPARRGVRDRDSGLVRRSRVGPRASRRSPAGDHRLQAGARASVSGRDR
jgi:hypothetical protein